ncbi:MAG TPA: hypothetical protein PK178_13310 [Smithellaceae bacterium]|nr:hypothetical protein [Smithellaceae bacterium]
MKMFYDHATIDKFILQLITRNTGLVTEENDFRARLDPFQCRKQTSNKPAAASSVTDLIHNGQALDHL